MLVPNCPGAKLSKKYKWVFSAIACKNLKIPGICVVLNRYEVEKMMVMKLLSLSPFHSLFLIRSKGRQVPGECPMKAAASLLRALQHFFVRLFLSPSSRRQIRTKITQEKTSIISPVKKDCISLRLKFCYPFQEIHRVEWITPRGDILPVVVSF